ncbi:MAG TPA: glycosyltransferase family 87 protein [Gemmataceae bacterium]|nr:glycosyltransferase family 87 protein [Gemmataceae bacterium]
MDAIVSRPRFAFFREHWFVLALIAFFAALSVQYSFKVSDERRENRSAFLRWRDQIQDLDAGVNIWERHNYPNPPIMVVLLKPLVLLPPLAGSLLWFYLKVVMALAAIQLVFRLVETPGQPWPIWAKGIAVVLSLRPMMGDLSHGNINLFILFLCVTTLYCFRRRRDWAAGICLALAIACKVTPALFVPYFVWKRSWKVLAGCGIGLVLFFWLIPGVFFGFQQNQAYVTSWYKHMIEPYAFNGVVTTDHENQSLPGLVHRMVTDSASFSTFIEDQYVVVESHSIVSWEPWVARGIVKLCMLAFAGVVVWVCRHSSGERRRWQLAAEYSLILLGMLLFSERTWKHHCVTMLVPFCVLCYYLSACRPGRRMKGLVIGAMAVAALLMASTSTGWGKSVAGSGALAESLERMGKLAQVYGAYVGANLALTLALVLVLRRQLALSPPETHSRHVEEGVILHLRARIESADATIAANLDRQGLGHSASTR